MDNNILDEQKIRRYCMENGYNYKYFGDNTIITTGLDVWRLKIVEVFKKELKAYIPIIKVEHQNVVGNKTKKIHFHTQRYAQDVDYVFTNIIIPHEQKGRAYQKAFVIKDLLSQQI